MQSFSQTVTINEPKTSFLHTKCPSCGPINSGKALKRKFSHSMEMLNPSSPWVYQRCLWPLRAPVTSGEGLPLPSLSSALWRQNHEQTETEISHLYLMLLLTGHCHNFDAVLGTEKQELWAYYIQWLKCYAILTHAIQSVTDQRDEKLFKIQDCLMKMRQTDIR